MGELVELKALWQLTQPIEGDYFVISHEFTEIPFFTYRGAIGQAVLDGNQTILYGLQPLIARSEKEILYFPKPTFWENRRLAIKASPIPNKLNIWGWTCKISPLGEPPLEPPPEPLTIAVSVTQLSLEADTLISYTYPDSFRNQAIDWTLVEAQTKEDVRSGSDFIPDGGQTQYNALDFQGDGAQVGKSYFYLESVQTTGQLAKTPIITLLT